MAEIYTIVLQNSSGTFEFSGSTRGDIVDKINNSGYFEVLENRHEEDLDFLANLKDLEKVNAEDFNNLRSKTTLLKRGLDLKTLYKGPKTINRKLSKYSSYMRGRNKPCRRVAVVNKE